MALAGMTTREQVAWAGVRIEVVTVVWMVIEGVVAIAAGIVAHSLVLVAFGMDSGIELVSGGILLWRLTMEARGGTLERVAAAERRAAWVVAAALLGLCLYIVLNTGEGVLHQIHPETAPMGVILAVVAVIGMPLLAQRKRALADQLGSAALRGDAACSLTCAAMAATLLVGLGLKRPLRLVVGGPSRRAGLPGLARAGVARSLAGCRQRQSSVCLWR